MIYWQLLWVYLKIGMFGFGGGYAMLSLIQHEIVDLHHWLTPQQFTDVVAISQMTPGPIGINSATYVGYAVTQSVWGAVLATVAVCLPSFRLDVQLERNGRSAGLPRDLRFRQKQLDEHRLAATN